MALLMLLVMAMMAFWTAILAAVLSAAVEFAEMPATVESGETIWSVRVDPSWWIAGMLWDQ